MIRGGGGGGGGGGGAFFLPVPPGTAPPFLLLAPLPLRFAPTSSAALSPAMAGAAPTIASWLLHDAVPRPYSFLDDVVLSNLVQPDQLGSDQVGSDQVGSNLVQIKYGLNQV